MKTQLIEFLLCSTIATYCMVRCVRLMPEIISMAYKAVAAATQRVESIENLMEPEEPAILD